MDLHPIWEETIKATGIVPDPATEGVLPLDNDDKIVFVTASPIDDPDEDGGPVLLRTRRLGRGGLA